MIVTGNFLGEPRIITLIVDVCTKQVLISNMLLHYPIMKQKTQDACESCFSFTLLKFSITRHCIIPFLIEYNIYKKCFKTESPQ